MTGTLYSDPANPHRRIVVYPHRRIVVYEDDNTSTAPWRPRNDTAFGAIFSNLAGATSSYYGPTYDESLANQKAAWRALIRPVVRLADFMVLPPTRAHQGLRALQWSARIHRLPTRRAPGRSQAPAWQREVRKLRRKGPAAPQRHRYRTHDRFAPTA